MFTLDKSFFVNMIFDPECGVPTDPLLPAILAGGTYIYSYDLKATAITEDITFTDISDNSCGYSLDVTLSDGTLPSFVTKAYTEPTPNC